MAFETAEHIMRNGLESFGRYYGIYRGMVSDNEDPQAQNRIKVWVPGIQGGGINLWALPRNQAGSLNAGFKYLTPRIGDTVYITFEDGDPAFPLWEYHSWSIHEIPNPLAKPNSMGFRTPNGNEAFIDDDEGAMWVRMNGNVYIISDSSINITAKKGIVIDTGKNGGLINIKGLTDKLNNLIGELENLKAAYNVHIHSDSNSAPTTPPSNPFTNTFTKFNTSDYEDKTFLH